jgi:hypothetical protein
MTGRTGLDRRTLADLTERLARARPEAIRAVVALIDRLPERGEADALIAPMRPRLALMRDIVRRPASFGRVLAHPFEELLVAPDAWRRGSLSVPRTAMPVAIAVAAEALPEEVRRDVSARLADATMDDAAAIRSAGATIWPAAAARFSEIEASGLPPGLALPMRAADLRALLGGLGETLRLAGPLAAILSATPRGTVPAWEQVERALRDAAAEAAALSPECFARAGLILMRRFMAAGPVVGLLREAAGRAAGGGAERRLGAALDTFLAELPGQLPDAASLALLPHPFQQAAVAETVAIVERAGQEIGTWQGERRDNLREVETRMAAVLRRRVPECLSGELLAPLARIHAGGLAAGGGPAGVEGLEAAARAAAAMVAAARRLGPADDLAMALRRAAETVSALAVSAPQGAPADRIGRTDLARIVEILAGPDAAERVLGPAA